MPQICSADIALKATLSDDGKLISYATDLRYALSADNQQLSLLLLVLEDGIVSFQQNAFSTATSETLGEWCNNGQYAKYTVYPYTHNHVLRSVIGQTYSGTIGLFPSSLEGGVTYTATLSSECPGNVIDVANLSAVAVLIDTQSGQVVNAAKARVKAAAEGIETITEDLETIAPLRTLSGSIIKRNATAADLQQLPEGIYLLGGRKVMVR